MFRIILLLWSMNYADALPTSFTKSLCKNQCGDVSIPFPFGIGVNCSVDDWFEIVCNESLSSSPKPFLKRFNLEVLDISITENRFRVSYPIFSVCNNVSMSKESVVLSKSPFYVSSTKNKFLVVGSDCNSNRVSVRSSNGSVLVDTMDTCTTPDLGWFAGSNIICCQYRPPTSDFEAFNTTIEPMSTSGSHLVRGCMYAFLVDYTVVNSSLMENMNVSATVPVVLGWGIPSTLFTSLPISKDSDGKNIINSTYRCYFHSISTFWNISFTCDCLSGYEGNPYLSDGCQGKVLRSDSLLFFLFIPSYCFLYV